MAMLYPLPSIFCVAFADACVLCSEKFSPFRGSRGTGEGLMHSAVHKMPSSLDKGLCLVAADHPLPDIHFLKVRKSQS